MTDQTLIDAMSDGAFTPLEIERDYKISRGTQCRKRNSGTFAPFFTDGGKILYPKRLFLEWLAQKVVNSSAEIPAEKRGSRYQHLAKARELALSARRTKATGKSIKSGAPSTEG